MPETVYTDIINPFTMCHNANNITNKDNRLVVKCIVDDTSSASNNIMIIMRGVVCSSRSRCKIEGSFLI